MGNAATVCPCMVMLLPVATIECSPKEKVEHPTLCGCLRPAARPKTLGKQNGPTLG